MPDLICFCFGLAFFSLGLTPVNKYASKGNERSEYGDKARSIFVVEDQINATENCSHHENEAKNCPDAFTLDVRTDFGSF